MPHPSDIKISKLFSYDKTQGSVLSDIFIDNCSNKDRADQRIIVLIELRRSRQEYRSAIDEIIENAVSVFEASNKKTPEMVLEDVLESLNELLPTFAQRKNASWFDDLHLMVGVAEHGQIHFSQVGDIAAYLVQEGSISVVSENQNSVNPLKPFGHITSGLINPGDSLFFTTPALTDYIDEERLAELCDSYPPQTIVAQLERILKQVPAFVTFAAVFVKFITEYDEVRAASVKRDETFEEEEVVQQVQARIPQRRKSKVRNSRSAIALYIISSLWHYIVIVGKTIATIAIGFYKLCIGLALSEKRNEQERQFVSAVAEKTRAAKNKVLSLPKITRYSLIALILIIFVLLHTLVLQGQKQQVVKQVDAYNEGLLLVAQKQQDVNNAIIYEDEKQAESLLLEIDGILQSLVPRNETQREQIDQYLEDNARELNKIRRINYITDPLVRLQLDSIAEQPSAIVKAGDRMILAAETALYDITGDEPQLIGSATEPIVELIHEDENTFAISENNLVFTVSDSVIEALLPNSEDFIAASTYADNIYTLDAAGSISRYAGGSAGFSSPTAWLSDGVTVENGSDLTIDGNIYVITHDGQIYKYLRGNREEFTHRQLNPGLGENTKIYTTFESDFLYILDPENNRVAIITKEEGSIKDQFTSPKFASLRDLAIDEAEGSISVLTDEAVYLLAIKK